ncbi:MAG: radical SAM protein [Spirochaetales bacterium]|nr:radical SAM protein [Spirochaetales bacterium]
MRLIGATRDGGDVDVPLTKDRDDGRFEYWTCRAPDDLAEYYVQAEHGGIVSKIGRWVRASETEWVTTHEFQNFPLKNVFVSLTWLCNLKCYHCWQVGNYNAENAYDGYRCFMSENTFTKIIDEFAQMKYPYIFLWGGEPLMHPKVISFIRYIKQNRLFCILNTNGLLLNRYADELIDSGLDKIVVSLDGPKEIHEQIRGKDIFDRVVDGIGAVTALKGISPDIEINCVISDKNVHHLEEMIDIARSIGVKIAFEFPMFLNDTLPNDYQEFYTTHLERRGRVSVDGFVNETLSDIDLDSFSHFLEEVDANKHFVRCSPNFDIDSARTYFNDITADDFQGYRAKFDTDTPVCGFIWKRASILPTGEVTVCPDYSDYTIGNINDSSLFELWNNERFAAFRREVADKGMPVCKRCAHYYHDTRFLYSNSKISR